MILLGRLLLVMSRFGQDPSQGAGSFEIGRGLGAPKVR